MSANECNKRCQSATAIQIQTQLGHAITATRKAVFFMFWSPLQRRFSCSMSRLALPIVRTCKASLRLDKWHLQSAVLDCLWLSSLNRNVWPHSAVSGFTTDKVSPACSTHMSSHLPRQSTFCSSTKFFEQTHMSSHLPCLKHNWFQCSGKWADLAIWDLFLTSWAHIKVAHKPLRSGVLPCQW